MQPRCKQQYLTVLTAAAICQMQPICRVKGKQRRSKVARSNLNVFPFLAAALRRPFEFEIACFQTLLCLLADAIQTFEFESCTKRARALRSEKS